MIVTSRDGNDSALTYDVAVAGGGPAGIAAAIAAARLGRSVVLLERHPYIGGMGTAALVSNFCNAHFDGQRMILGGIFAELRDRLIEDDALHVTGGLEPYDPESFIRHAQAMCNGAGVDTRLNVILKSVTFNDNAPATLTLSDNTVIHARTVVDASGDATIAQQAGVPTTKGRASDGAVMPLTYCYILGPVNIEELRREIPDALHTDKRTGQPFIYLGYQAKAKELVAQARAAGDLTIPRDRIAVAFGLPGRPDHIAVNFGRVFIDDPTDPAQFEKAQEIGKEQVYEGVQFFRKYFPGFRDAQLVQMAQQIGVRESRQIVGQYTLTAEDVLSCRQFEDVIAQCCYSIDIHEPGSDKTTMRGIPKGSHYDIPWRCLIPRSGPRNLIVAGRSISATHEAMSSFRVTPSVMAIGEAAGIGAALAATEDGDITRVPYTQVREHLLENNGILQ
jgi:hypothetical protein